MRKNGFTILLFMLASYAFTDSLYNNIDSDQILKNNSSNSSFLNNDYVVNKTFTNFNQVLTAFTGLGIATKVVAIEDNEPKNVLIKSKTNVKDFVNFAASKFGYKWTLTNDVLTFSAINPVKKKQELLIENGLSVANINISQQPWILDPKDKTLRNTLTKWAKKAGWQLIWNVKADYPITTSWSIPGTFEIAINEVLKASQNTDTPLQAIMHDGNHVLELYSPTISR